MSRPMFREMWGIVAGVALLMVVGPQTALADDTGPISPTSASAPGAIQPWMNPSNALTSDNQYSQGDPFAFETDTLILSFPAINIPPDATLDGLEVEIEGYVDGGNFPQWRPRARTSDGTIHFFFSGGGVTASDGNSALPDGFDICGSPTNTWNVTTSGLTTALVTAGQFQIHVYGGDTFNGSFRVDHVTATFYYTPAAPIPTLSQWALIIFALLLCAGGAWQIKRMRLPEPTA